MTRPSSRSQPRQDMAPSQPYSLQWDLWQQVPLGAVVAGHSHQDPGAADALLRDRQGQRTRHLPQQGCTTTRRRVQRCHRGASQAPTPACAQPSLPASLTAARPPVGPHMHDVRTHDAAPAPPRLHVSHPRPCAQPTSSAQCSLHTHVAPPRPRASDLPPLCPTYQQRAVLAAHTCCTPPSSRL